jgi:hypothetical protein
MATSGRRTGIVGYKVQAAVDQQHHVIVAHEVTNIGHDRTQLATVATAAREAIGHQELTALADRDEYRCPAGERAIWRMTTVERGQTLHRYWPSACPRCPIKSQCTPADYRRITSREHEAVLEVMQRRLDRTPEASRIRRQTVEHPFGTLKAWMGSTHFLTKTLPRV